MPFISNETYAVKLSGDTIYSGGTDLSLLFATSSQVTNNTNLINTRVILSGDTMTGLLTVPSLSGTSISGGTIFSASTDLSLLFASQAAVSSQNTANTNLFNTKVNRSGDTMTGQLTTTALSATTLSGGTIYSGSTELSSLFPTKNIRKIFAQSRTVTGNTVNNAVQVLASVLIPGNTLAVGDSIECDALWRFSEGSASNKIGKIYLSSGATNLTIGTTSADVLFSGQRTAVLQTWRGNAKVYITGSTGQIWFSNGNSTTTNINETDADIPYLSLPINQDMYVIFAAQRPTTTTGITQLMCYDVFINKA